MVNTGTFCTACWVNYQPDDESRWAAHKRLTCTDEWYEDSGRVVCMCGCSPRARERRAAGKDGSSV